MSAPSIKETIVYKKELLLKSTTDNQLEEREYLFSHILFNENGKVAAERHYDPEGKIIQEYAFLYDQNGFLKEEILREDDGFIAEHKTYEPDDKNNIHKEFRHYTDGSFDTVTYQYNDQGLLRQKETIDPDGDLESVEKFEYNQSQLAHYELFDGEGELMSEKKITYDEKGNALEVYEFDGSEGQSVRKTIEYNPSGIKKETLTYDHAGKLVEKVEMKENSEGLLEQVIEETLTKKNTVDFQYDDHGNIVFQEEYDRNGELVSRVKRTFDDKKQLLNSDVFIHGGGRGLSRNYTLRQEYIYY